VPKAGPLKDELTYMPDMIENFSNGIDHNKAKLVLKFSLSNQLL